MRSTGGRPPEIAVRLAATGGLAGPLLFAGSWILGSAITPGYSVVDDPISRLAAVGADTRTLMTAGFIGFGLGLPLYAVALRRTVGGPAWMAAAATGLATLAVAALPLDHSTPVDGWHGVAAGFGYVTLAATPLLAVRPLWRRGHRRLARLGGAAAAVSGAALLASTRLPTGAFQRLGLSTADLWVATSALAVITGRLPTIGRSGRAVDA
ncbi:MAG: DUF998 domain-containing protein [Ilumatobacteraceae bacterium]